MTLKSEARKYGVATETRIVEVLDCDSAMAMVLCIQRFLAEHGLQDAEIDTHWNDDGYSWDTNVAIVSVKKKSDDEIRADIEAKKEELKNAKTPEEIKAAKREARERKTYERLKAKYEGKS